MGRGGKEGIREVFGGPWAGYPEVIGVLSAPPAASLGGGKERTREGAAGMAGEGTRAGAADSRRGSNVRERGRNEARGAVVRALQGLDDDGFGLGLSDGFGGAWSCRRAFGEFLEQPGRNWALGEDEE